MYVAAMVCKTVHLSVSGCLCVSLSSLTHSLSQKLQQIRATNNTYHNSFFVRTVPIWNSLPASVAEAPTLAIFKRELAKTGHYL